MRANIVDVLGSSQPLHFLALLIGPNELDSAVARPGAQYRTSALHYTTLGYTYFDPAVMEGHVVAVQKSHSDAYMVLTVRKNGPAAQCKARYIHIVVCHT